MLTTASPASPAANERFVLDHVADVFGLGQVDEFQQITEGLLNRNWKLTAAGTRYAVKQVLDVGAEQARRQHAATRALALRGLPVPAPRRDRSGETLWEGPHGNLCVLPWVAGTHIRGRDWTTAQAAHVGDLLARLHLSLAEVMPAIPEPAKPLPVPEPALAKAAIDHYLGIIDERPALDPFDTLALRRLRQRRDLLERAGHLRPDETAPVEPLGWVHGDFHDLNLLWCDGKVAAVIDWDRLNVRPLAAEIVRSATLLFASGDERGLDLGQVAAFTTAYRRARPLADGQLADATHRLWWERVCDFWQLKRHYDQGDDSCDHLFTSASALLTWWSEHLDEVTAAFAT